MGSKFHALFEAVCGIMAQTPRSSSLLGDPQVEAVHLLHTATKFGLSVFELVEVLAEPSALHT
jgi:hypothetical protein